MNKIVLDDSTIKEIIRLHSELSYPLDKIKKTLGIGRKVIERCLVTSGVPIKTRSQLVCESIPELNKQWLCDRYHVDCLSIDNIASLLNTNSQVIKTAFKKFDIKSRSAKESKKISTFRAIPQLNDIEFLISEYVDNKKSVANISQQLGVSDTAVRNALDRHGVKRRSFKEQLSTKVQPLDKLMSSKIARNLRSRLSIAISNNQKRGSAVRDLGCSILELKQHLESKFQPGMTWENYGRGGWEIDHTVPLSNFDLNDRDQFLKACHYTNLQPLWRNQNRIKSDGIPTLVNELYIVAGQSGSGKSWVCEQLVDKYSYLSYDKVPKEQHIFRLIELDKFNKPILYDPLRKPVTLFNRYKNIGRVHLVVIVEDAQVIDARLKQRGGGSDNIELFRKKFLKNSLKAEFSGTSQQVLDYLRNRV